MKIASIIKAIENYANPALQEKWDNTGLQVGSALVECSGVLICLDPTPQIVEEAIHNHCNLIISHHPLFFKPIKSLTGQSANQSAAIAAITAGISIYSSHTAVDSAHGGVSYLLAQKLGIKPIKVLSPLSERYISLQANVPSSLAQDIRLALMEIPSIKNVISNNSLTSTLEGPQVDFDPVQGVSINQEQATTITAILAPEQMREAENALLDCYNPGYSYYTFSSTLNADTQQGLGIIGSTDTNLNAQEFALMVKEALDCDGLRTSLFEEEDATPIRRVAVCGGAGGEFIQKAIAQGAQAYVTSDIRYHDFVDYRDQILLIDAGHYSTEWPVTEMFADVLKKQFPELSIIISTTQENPIKFL